MSPVVLGGGRVGLLMYCLCVIMSKSLVIGSLADRQWKHIRSQ